MNYSNIIKIIPTAGRTYSRHVPMDKMHIRMAL